MEQPLFGLGVAADLMPVLDHDGAALGGQFIDIGGIQRPALHDMGAVFGRPEPREMRLARPPAADQQQAPLRPARGRVQHRQRIAIGAGYQKIVPRRGRRHRQVQGQLSRQGSGVPAIRSPPRLGPKLAG